MIKRTKRGFTLVELIVVIAILGILAGVAIPVYSGYISKAHQAADNMLLGAVNTAVAAARAENGFVNLSDAEPNIVDKKITGITVTITTLDEDAGAAAAIAAVQTKVQDAFEVYFGDNKNTALQYCETAADFDFNATSQSFIIVKGGASTGGTTLQSFKDKNGKDIYYSQEAVDAYLASNYQKKDATVWTDTVSGLANTLSNQHDVLASLTDDSTFAAYLTAASVDADNDKAVANALVTFAAHTLSNVDLSSVGTALNGNFKHDLEAMYNLVSPGKTPSYAQKAVSAAFLYAVSGGYASSKQSKGDSHAQDIFNNPSVFDVGTVTTYMNNLNQEKYAAYLASAEGQTDITGMISAMGLVSANEGQVLSYLSDGNNWNFSNGNIVDVIREILTKGTPTS